MIYKFPPQLLLLTYSHSIFRLIMATLSANHTDHFEGTSNSALQVNDIFKRKEQQSTVNGKIQQFRVQIRNKQISQYKNNIRQQMLKTSFIQDLIQQIPFDNQSSYPWASKLVEVYSSSSTYQLTDDKVVEIFKLVERFPNKFTLHLFEIVVIRADKSAVYNLFQYDVMRLLHGVINFATTVDKVNSKCTSYSQLQERQIMKEVVISSVESIQSNQTKSFKYHDKLELARITLRIISQLCKKNSQTRNFSVLNHKTYTYCLKVYKCFEKDIELEFFMVLQSLTFYRFEREGQQQFRRITNKITQLFLEGEMNVKIQVVQQDERSYLKAYQSLVAAVKNLLTMKSQCINTNIIAYKCNQTPVILIRIHSIISQCNYVIDYPSIKEKESLIPIKLLKQTVYLAMQVFQMLEHQQYFKRQLQHPIFYEIIHFLQNKEIGMSSADFIIVRRSSYFLLSNFFFGITDQNEIYNFIFCNNVATSQQNLITTIAYMFDRQNNMQNRIQICLLLKNIFEFVPAHILQPLLIPSHIFYIMMDKLLETQMWTGQYMTSQQNVANIHILNTIKTFFQAKQHSMGQKIQYYRDLILKQYEERLNTIICNSHNQNTFVYYANLFLERVRLC